MSAVEDVLRTLIDFVPMSEADRQTLRDKLDASAGPSQDTPTTPGASDVAPTSTPDQTVDATPPPSPEEVTPEAPPSF